LQYLRQRTISSVSFKMTRRLVSVKPLVALSTLSESMTIQLQRKMPRTCSERLMQFQNRLLGWWWLLESAVQAWWCTKSWNKSDANDEIRL